MEKTSVLVVIRPAAGGMRQHLFLLLKYLDRKTFEPRVVITPDAWLEGKLREIGLKVEVVEGIGEGSPFKLGSATRALYRAAKKHKVELIHSHGYWAGLSSGLAARIAGVKHICTIHTHIPEASGWSKRALAAVARTLLRRLADRIIVVAKEVGRPFGKSSRVRLVYNGVEIDQFSAGREEPSIRDELGLPRAAKLVGAVARLSPEKGIDSFIEAASRIDADADTHFLIAGDGPLRREIKAEIRRLGLAEKVHLLGFREDVPRILSGLDVLVLSSRSEGFPMILLEAMAAGVPVVATNVGGVGEVVNGETGVTVPPGDSTAIADSVAKLLKQPKFRDKLSRAARQRIEKEFAADIMARKTELLYEETARS